MMKDVRGKQMRGQGCSDESKCPSSRWKRTSLVSESLLQSGVLFLPFLQFEFMLASGTRRVEAGRSGDGSSSRLPRRGDGQDDKPKSLMLKTPGAAVELALRCLGAASSLGGLEERPWTAESTLERGVGAASVDMIVVGVFGCDVIHRMYRYLTLDVT